MIYKFCPECGIKFDKQYKFCPECGYNLSGESEVKTQGLFGGFDEAAVVGGGEFDGLESAFDAQIESQENNEIDYQTELKKAQLYCMRGKYFQAKRIYEQLLEKDAGDINAHIGVLRTVSNNLTEYNEDLAQEQFNFLNKFLTEEELIKAEPQLKNYYKIKEQYFIDKENARLNALREEEYQKARENFKKQTYAREAGFCEIRLGAYPQSLMKPDVKILVDQPDPQNGYYVGTDYNYYKEFNGKYFMVEPVIWHQLNQYYISYFSLKILGYTTFGAKDYENSNLKKVLAELLTEIKPEKEFLREVKYSNPYPESVEEKIIEYSHGHYKYAENGYRYQKDSSKIYTGCIFPLQIADVEDSYVSVTNSKRGFTDYALEQYRVLTKNFALNEPSTRYWTRTIPPSGYVYMGDLNKKMFKHDRLYAKECMRESENCIAGVRPMINVDYNRLISVAKEKKNGF